MPYLDTSVLGSYYCPEALSQSVNRVLASVADAVISPLVEVEFYSLLALKVRTREMTRAGAQAVVARFRAHRGDQLYRMVEIGAAEYGRASDWLGQFAIPLRALDALHLAAAIANGQTLITTDKALAAAAGQLRVSCQLIKG